jgi:transcription termination factor Rho
MFAILKKRAKAGEQIFGDGALEVLPDGFGFLRSPDASYMASTMTSISLRKSAVSICIPVTRLRGKYVLLRMASAISHW